MAEGERKCRQRETEDDGVVVEMHLKLCKI